MLLTHRKWAWQLLLLINEMPATKTTRLSQLRKFISFYLTRKSFLDRFSETAIHRLKASRFQKIWSTCFGLRKCSQMLELIKGSLAFRPCSELSPIAISSEVSATSVAALLAYAGTTTRNSSAQYFLHKSTIFSAAVPSPPRLAITISNMATTPTISRGCENGRTSFRVRGWCGE